MRPRNAGTWLAVIGVAVAAVACALVPAKPLPPKVELAGVRVLRLSPPDLRLRIAFDAGNPNGFPLRVHSLAASIVVNGAHVADAALPGPVVLPPGETVRIDVDVTTGLRQLAGVLDRRIDAAAVPWEVAGSAVVQDGVVLPFSRRGQLPVAAWLSRGAP
jgi:LEA14-like dessication related protein